MSFSKRSSRKHQTKRTGGKHQASPSCQVRPFLEKLEDRTLLNNRLDPLSNALSTALDQVDAGFRSVVAQSTTALPVLNRSLSSVQELADSVDRFQGAILSRLREIPDADLAGAQARTVIQDALFAKLTQVNILGDRNGGGVTKDDVLVENVNLDAGNVTVEVRLTGSVDATSQTFQFGTGLPGVPFQIDGAGELNVTASIDYRNLRFGLSSGVFFLDTSGAGEFTASVTAALRNTSMSGIIGFLAVNARPSGPTQLTAGLNVDVYGNASALQVAAPRLTGSADVNLTLETALAALTDKAPSIATDFQMHWELGGGNLGNELAGLGAEPTVNFSNVRVAMGSFVGSVVGPIVENIQTALKPIQPVLSVLNYRLPGLSDLVEFGGGGPVSLLTLAKAASAIGALPANVQLLVRLADTVNDLNSAVQSIVLTGSNVWLPVGSFDLNQSNDDLRGLPVIGQPGQSLRSFASSLDPLTNVSTLKSIAGGSIASLEQLVNNADESFLSRAAKDQLGKLIDQIKNKLERLDNGFKLEFPILQNPAEGAFKLLLGQNVDFVTFTGQYHFDARVEETYNMFKVLLFQVKGFLRGDIDLDLFFKMGYDSYGLRQALKNPGDIVGELSKGLFIDTSRELIHLNGGVSIGVAAEIPVIGFTDPIFGERIGVSAGVEVSGGLSINDFQFKLSTSSPDHKFRVDYQADHLFDTAGTVSAGVKFEVVAHTPIPLLDDIVLYSKTIASHTLIDLNSEFHKANPFKGPAGVPPQRVPVITDLNAFPEANDGVPNRIYMDEINGQYVLRAFNGSSTVPFFSLTKPVDTVERITVLGGGDDDSFYPRKVGGSTFSGGRSVTIDGRGGRNVLEVRTSAPQALRSNFVFSNGLVTGPFDLHYQGIDEITAYAVGGHHTSQIRELEDGMKLTIFGSSHSNSFIVGNGGVGGIGGELILHGSSGADSLEFDDRNNPFPARWVITDTAVSRMMNYFTVDIVKGSQRVFHVATMELALDAIDSVTIRGGTTSIHIAGLGDDVNRFEVLATNLPVTILGGSSTDHYIFGSETQQTRAPVYSNISITDKGGDQDTLIFNERGVKFPTVFGLAPHVVYTVDTTSITRRETSSGITAFPTTIAISGLEDVRLYGGNYPGTEYQIAGFKGGGNNSLLSVFTGIERDIVTLGTYADGLGKLQNKVLLYDSGGVDNLTVNSKGLTLAAGTLISPNGAETKYTADGRLLSPNGAEVSYSNLEHLFVRASLGQSPVAVQSVAQNVDATIFGASKVNLGAGSFANLKGPVDVKTDDGRQIYSDGYRGNATTALSIDDSHSPTPRSFVLGPSSVSTVTLAGGLSFNASFGSAVLSSLELLGGSAGNTITLTDTRSFSRLPQVVLNTGLGADTVNIEQTHTDVVVNGQKGADVVNVGKAGSVQGIARQLTVTNTGNWSTLNVDDAADTLPRTVTLNVGSYATIGGLAPGLIRFRRQDLRALNIRGGSGGNTFDILNTAQSTIPGGSPTTLFSGAGSDIVNVFATTGALVIDPQAGGNQITIGGRLNQQGNLSNLHGDVTLRSSSDDGRNFLDVIDGEMTSDYAYTMDARRLFRTDTVGGTTASVFYGELALGGLDLVTGNGNDRFQINGTPAADPYEAGGSVSAAVRIDGSGGVNTLDYSGYGSSEYGFSEQGLVSWYRAENNAADSVGGNDGALINGVAFATGVSGQAFQFDGVDDYVRLNNSLNLQPAQVSVESWVNSSSSPGVTRYVVDKGASGDLAASYALYTSLSGGLTFYVYDGSTYVESPDAGRGIWDGNWHHVVGTYDGFSVRLYVDGGEVGTGTPTTIPIAYNLPTSNDLFLGGYGNSSYAGYYYSGSIDEVSIFNRPLSNSEILARFTAGPGARPTLANLVVVNLLAGTATGLGGGIANIRNVIGSAGNDILVGKGGSSLSGGAGRDLLIGGAGIDQLDGGAGEDVLVDGTTAHDTNSAALLALMAEWTRPDLPYSTRAHHLLNGGGLNGQTLLNLATFAADGGSNTLTGAAELDLFFGSRARDFNDWDRDGGEIFVDPDGIQASTTIDAGVLTGTTLWVDGIAYPTASPFRISLIPGGHSFYNWGGSIQYFAVADDGTISYDPALEGVMSGQGTANLVIQGRAVSIDASALTGTNLWVDGSAFAAAAPFTTRLLPGRHSFYNYGGAAQYFAVADDGTISYDPALEGVISGQGTANLVIQGRAVSIDASFLTGTTLWVNGNPFASAAPFTTRLLPGRHAFYNSGGSAQYFAVADDGTISYDPALEGVMSGQGTTNLVIQGRAVTIDASALTGTNLWVDGNSFAVATPFTTRLLPGRHAFYNSGGSAQYFAVADDGSISYDPALEGVMSGQGTTNLVIQGRAVTIDASVLTGTTLWVDGNSFAVATPFTTRLLPGWHAFYNYGGSAQYFVVADDGTISYDAALEGVMSGQGTANLVIQGRAVTIDASVRGTSTLWLDGTALGAATLVNSHLLPGPHNVWFGNGPSYAFSVDADGTIDYDPALDGILSGRGTRTLTFLV
jgi:hypothetical protein